MAVDVEIKIKGIKELQERLYAKYETLINTLDVALLQICEDAVTYSVANKGYKDHTSNLKNSISFALYRDGNLIRMHEGKIPKPDESPEGQQQVSDNLLSYCNKDGVIQPKGYSLAIVAGMNYGKYVEYKGYNVVYMTKHFLKEELEKVLKETLDNIASA